jgi:hypothetical protein
MGVAVPDASGIECVVAQLVLTDEIRHLILSKAASGEIEDAAVANGMNRLREDGLDKVREGITSIPEMLMVLGNSGELGLLAILEERVAVAGPSERMRRVRKRR